MTEASRVPKTTILARALRGSAQDWDRAVGPGLKKVAKEGSRGGEGTDPSVP